MTASSGKLRRASDVVAIARRSLLGVRGASGGGTGWVVLGNGLVMTSHEAVGYQTEVSLELENGKRAYGRVIWADVARDLALVLPVEHLPIPPLLPRPDLPRLGEPVLALSAVPDQPFRVVSALVSAIDYRVGPLRCFELDTVVGSGGGPILDLDGRVLGVGGLDLPRGTRRRLHAEPTVPRSLAIPIAALQRALAAVDVPAEQFSERNPNYRCPGCSEPFQPRDERCLACGRLLPHGWESPSVSPGAAAAGAERLIRDLLAEHGAAPATARVGRRSYRLTMPGEGGAETPVLLEYDEDGMTVRGRVALVRVPIVNQEPFFRFLLTLNDQAVGSQRLSIEGDTVYLVFNEPTAMVRPGEGAQRVQELVRESERYKKALAEPFEAGPVV